MCERWKEKLIVGEINKVVLAYSGGLDTSIIIPWLKENYGDKLCLVGNIDIDEFLTRGTPETIDAEVKRRITQFGKNGRYIISDSNSVPSYCKTENILAMSRAVEKYRYIYSRI